MPRPRYDSVGWAVAPRGASLGLQALLTAGVIVLGAVLFFATQDALLPALERGFLSPGVGQRERVGAPLVVFPAKRYEPTEAAAGGSPLTIDHQIYWTPELAASRLDPLPDRFDQLMAEGKTELPAYRRVRAELFANRWNPWRTSWRNRLVPIEVTMPPLDFCARYTDLIDRCVALHAVASSLLAIADSTSLASAEEGFRQARAQLETWRAAEKARLEEEARLAEEARQAEEERLAAEAEAGAGAETEGESGAGLGGSGG